jgi:glutathione S-transferase
MAEAMLKLYEHPLSPYAQKIKIALYEKGIEFEIARPNIFGPPEGDFHSASLHHQVPALVDGDFTLHDSTIILEYLEDRFPEPALLDKEPRARARARMIEDVCDTYFEAITWGLAEVRVFGRARGELAARLTTSAGKQIAGVHAYLERQLGDAPFFAGEAFGWGDLSVIPNFASALGNGFGPPPGSRLALWFARVSARSSVQKTLDAVREALAALPDLPALVESGAICRLYRDHRLEWMLRSGGANVVADGIAKKNIRFSVEIG